MAVAFDTSTTVESDTGTTVGGTHTPGSDPSLVILTIAIASDTALVASAPTYAATAMTLVGGPVVSGDAPQVSGYMYKLESPPAGAQAFNVALDKNNIHRSVTVATFTGTLSSGATRTAAENDDGGTGSTAPTVDATTVAGDLVYDLVIHGGGNTTRTAGAGQTKRWEFYTTAGTNNVGSAGSTETASGVTTTMSWTLGGTRAWAMIAVPIIPVAIESAAVDITATTAIAITATEVTSESAAVAITATSSITIAATAQIPAPCEPGPPFDTSIFGSGSPATLYVALLSYPWGPAEQAVEFSGCGYLRVPVLNNGTYWGTVAGSIRNLAQITFPQASCDQGTAKGWAIYDDPLLNACGNLIAHGLFGSPREVTDGVFARISTKNLVITTTGATGTLVAIETAPDLWSGYAWRSNNVESGVCQTCGFTVPVRELRYNRRYGWQCLPGGYGPGCWDGAFQRDEIIFIPPPDEGARRSSTPTDGITTAEDDLPDT